MKAILVTGGAGYIGSHTVVELLNNDYTVIVIDDFSNSNPQIFDGIKCITGKQPIIYNINLLDKEQLKIVFDKHKIDAVIHFAGYKSVGESIEKPLEYFRNNIVGTLILCEIMERYGVKKLVFSSSATVYGESNEPPMVETMPLSSTSPYGSSKIINETVLKDLSRTKSEWSIVILRYFNPVGAHESGLIGEEPNGIPNNLMPYITQVAAGKRDAFSVYGNDYKTIDGTGVRDYVHVVDIAKGHLKALEYINNNPGLDVINLGTGRGYSVLEVLNCFMNVNHVVVPYHIVARRPGDIDICYADVTKSKKLLGWVAEKGLKDMCRDSWRWQCHDV